MMSDGPIRREHSPDDGILWLHMKPPICSIGRYASYCIFPVAWSLQLPLTVC
jgi:hypothetical protein